MVKLEEKVAKERSALSSISENDAGKSDCSEMLQQKDDENKQL